MRYIRAVKDVTRFLGRSPDTATPEELRRYQLHLLETGTPSIVLNGTITALRFFFGVTRERPEALAKMCPVREPRKLPVVLSLEEVTGLIAAADKPQYQAALSVACGAGLPMFVPTAVPPCSSSRPSSANKGWELIIQRWHAL
jgi:integrase/recombinase XerD